MVFLCFLRPLFTVCVSADKYALLRVAALKSPAARMSRSAGVPPAVSPHRMIDHGYQLVSHPVY
jgi:hypothetical protein